MRLLVAIVTILISSQGARAAGYEGISAFAIQHKGFPCNDYRKALERPAQPALVLLWSTFGTSNKCLLSLLDAVQKRPHYVEIHISNEACRRNRRCKEGELLRNWSVKRLNKQIAKQSGVVKAKYQNRALKILATLAPVLNSNSQLGLSTGLENNYTKTGQKIVINWLREVWPYEIINNPMGKRHLYNADKLEYHGLPAKGPGAASCVYNNDGAELNLWQFKYAWGHFANCVRFMWFPGLQGINSAKFINPRERTFEFSDKDILTVKGVLGHG